MTRACTLLMSTLTVVLLSSPAAAESAKPDRAFTELSTGKLYVPPHLTPRDGQVDLIVHFHGGAAILPDAVDELRINAAVVVASFKGLSSAYRVPFEEPDRFAELLRDAERQLDLDPRFADAALGRVNLVSFSAGYGAVREIVKSPVYVERIDGILLTDSMYASYTGEPAEKTVKPAHVSPYVAFAQRAIKGEKAFVVTHTYLPPGGYAGTHECAAALLAMLGLQYEPMPEDEATRPETGKLRMVERAEHGGLRVYGYAGDTGEDHGDHLRATAAWLPLLPLEFLPEPPEAELDGAERKQEHERES